MFLILLLLAMSPATDSRAAGESWESCRMAVEHLHRESGRMVQLVQGAPVEQLDSIDFQVRLPAGPGCPSALAFEDMPSDLQARMSELTDGTNVERDDFSGRPASDALQLLQRVEQNEVNAKVSMTIGTRVRNAIEMVRTEKEMIRRELERRKIAGR